MVRWRARISSVAPKRQNNKFADSRGGIIPPVDALKRIGTLIDAVRADFPRRKAAAEALMRQDGLDGELDLTILPPTKARLLPTFDLK
jgi:hypothetical protein